MHSRGGEPHRFGPKRSACEHIAPARSAAVQIRPAHACPTAAPRRQRVTVRARYPAPSPRVRHDDPCDNRHRQTGGIPRHAGTLDDYRERAVRSVVSDPSTVGA